MALYRKPLPYRKTQLYRSSGLSVTATGLDSSAFGTPFVADAIRYITPIGPAGEVPGPHVDFEIRYLRPLPVGGVEFGATLVDQQNRTVEPGSFSSTSYGTPFVDFSTRTIEVPGTDDRVIPYHAVFDPKQYVHTSGMSLAAVPLPTASNKNIELRPPSLDYLQAGATRAYNLWQVVQHRQLDRFDEVVGTTVYNKNFELYAEGINSLRMRPYHEARLGADAVSLEGFDTALFGATVASNWVRDINVPGEDHFGGSMHLVGNVAQGYCAVGTDTAAYGTPDAVDGTVEIYINLPAQDSYGTPRASLSPIIVTVVEAAYDVLIGVPRASVSPQVVSPIWTGDWIPGWPMLEIKFRKIEPLAFPVPVPPAPTVYNRNREVRPQPAFGEFGVARAMSLRQYVTATSVYDGYFGTALARDRTSYIRPDGLVPAAGSGPVVLKYPPDPPPPLLIYTSGFGGAVGNHTVGDLVIRPPGINVSVVPNPVCTSNTIVCPSVVEDLTALTRHFIPTAIVIYASPTPAQDGYGKPNMSPLTVWATLDTPTQAVSNHPGPIFHTVDDPIFWNGTASGVGSPEASLRNRSLVASGVAGGEVSIPYVANQLQFIMPLGKSWARIPAPTIPNPGPISITGLSTLEFGYPVVMIAPESLQQISVSGLVGSVGDPVFSNWIRNLEPAGLDATLHGTTAANHEFPPFQFTGFNALLVGDHDVGHRVRSFQMDGFDATGFGPDVGGFSKRLRIYRLDRPRPVWTAGPLFGTARVEHALAYVGVTDIGPPPVMPPRVQHTVPATGFTASIIGEHRVDAEVDGTVFAYGIDALEVPRPATAFRIYMDGISGQLGEPRPANAVGVAGLTGEIGSGAVVGGPGHTCGMLPRAVVSGAIESAVFGEPSFV